MVAGEPVCGTSCLMFCLLGENHMCVGYLGAYHLTRAASLFVATLARPFAFGRVSLASHLLLA